MDTPFSKNYADISDPELLNLALAGDKSALQQIVLRHQVFIYNLAFKMTRNIEDAEDLTQEVFIKAITSLSRFEGRSQFRTWLYRIAVNHFLNTKKRKSELMITGFENYFNAIEEMPVYDLSEREQVELGESIEELRINCTAGMLLCLDREQRITYILGEMIGLDHKLAAEILDISAGNFRIRLMRARQDLYNWMNERCGLVNKSNPCRCARKTKGYIEAGFVDPGNLIFNTRHKQKIYELSKEMAASISNAVEDLYKNIFREHPLMEPVTTKKLIDEIFKNDLIKLILHV